LCAFRGASRQSFPIARGIPFLEAILAALIAANTEHRRLVVGFSFGTTHGLPETMPPVLADGVRSDLDVVVGTAAVECSLGPPLFLIQRTVGDLDAAPG